MKQISELVFRWISRNGYYPDNYIPDLVLSNYALYSLSVAPNYVDVWLWLWANNCFIDIHTTWVTNTDSSIIPLAVAEYRSADLYFRGTGQTIDAALEACITDMCRCYLSDQFIPKVNQPNIV